MQIFNYSKEKKPQGHGSIESVDIIISHEKKKLNSRPTLCKPISLGFVATHPNIKRHFVHSSGSIVQIDSQLV